MAATCCSCNTDRPANTVSREMYPLIQVNLAYAVCPSDLGSTRMVTDGNGKITGKRFTPAQARKFHDAITGQGLAYHDLVEIGVEVLEGRI